MRLFFCSPSVEACDDSSDIRSYSNQEERGKDRTWTEAHRCGRRHVPGVTEVQGFILKLHPKAIYYNTVKLIQNGQQHRFAFNDFV